jgi:hypothetical protein
VQKTTRLFKLGEVETQSARIEASIRQFVESSPTQDHRHAFFYSG